MNQGIAWLCVAAGGALGSLMRYLAGQWILTRVGPGFPWGTLIINVSGAFCIGVVLQYAAMQAGFNPYVRLFLATGILGGFTTFSTFSYEVVALSSGTFSWQSVLYAAVSVVCGIAAVFFGMVVGRTGP